MIDTITHIGKGSVIQHGMQSNRIYLMKLAPEDAESIVDKLIRLAQQEHYSKIFCKVPSQATPLFLARGFILEGYIPKFYQGKKDAFFVSKFMEPGRLSAVPQAALEKLHELLATPISTICLEDPADGYTFRKLGSADIPAIVKLYTETFATYPFPIHDPAYIQETMNEHVHYFGAFQENNLAAIASAEIDFEARNAEMTDFATSHAHSGHRLACRLLQTMEKSMKEQNICTLYTIARLQSIPMNKTFLRMGYTYSGTLINNTQISGSIETMNLYYKTVPE